MSLKAVIESVRAARHVEIILLVVLIAVLGLLAIGGMGNDQAAKSDVESRLARLLERMDGVGCVDVMISVDQDDRPVGVAVVASGALDMRVRLEMQSAIQALLDIDAQRIRIIGKGGSEG